MYTQRGTEFQKKFPFARAHTLARSLDRLTRISAPRYHAQTEKDALAISNQSPHSLPTAYNVIINIPRAHRSFCYVQEETSIIDMLNRG